MFRKCVFLSALCCNPVVTHQYRTAKRDAQCRIERIASMDGIAQFKDPNIQKTSDPQNPTFKNFIIIRTKNLTQNPIITQTEQSSVTDGIQTQRKQTNI